MPKIFLEKENKTLLCEKGSSLYDVLAKEGYIDAPCGGKGTCGKCGVYVDGKWVFSCNFYVENDISVVLTKKENICEIMSDGVKKDFKRDSFPPHTFGVAIDIGTTTIVAALVNMHSGEELCSLSCLNSQKAFGQDVITRIHYTIENTDGLTLLQSAVINDINSLISGLCSQNKVLSEEILQIAISGNTTMIHLLLGINPTSIAAAPYLPAFSGAVSRPARELSICAENAQIYCIPAISSFVGGDITSGILACNLSASSERELFIDIGTNGEMVLNNSGTMLSCSCAAGPALEGMNISCGMRAANGAIEDVTIDGDQVCISTIGDGSPIGICGSGLLSAISQMRKSGVINARGRLCEHPLVELRDGKRVFVLDKDFDIYISQNDIRQVQLAKGAILAGIYTMLNYAKLSVCDLDKVIVAGQFGAHLKEESLVGAGILPYELTGKITYVGNTSKSGAYICLMSDYERNLAENIVENVRYIELSSLNGYEDLFIKCISFEQERQI
ncbi:MAG: ASKHA domain-containing protein [Bacillota bacterium]|jgi:uncharacterized 2Fe-2S/4Fe-4S cluster protein (DUF4445 family)